MWNGRFRSLSGEGSDNSKGFLFPAPETNAKFSPYDHQVKTLMAAQGHMPSTELVEMAGTFGTEDTYQVESKFGGDLAYIKGGRLLRVTRDLTPKDVNSLNTTARSRFMASDAVIKNLLPTNLCGTTPDKVPDPDLVATRNEPIRRVIVERIQNQPAYAQAFSNAGFSKPINFAMIGAALAEFQRTLIFADAPIDKFARGDSNAMTPAQKRGALIFFAPNKGNCAACHSTSGNSHEMFSDFKMHNIGTPPVVPKAGNVEFQGPAKDEDFGLAEFTGTDVIADRYLFRSSPLRNVALQPTFMHNGAYTKLEDAIYHHLNARAELMNYTLLKSGLSSSIFKLGPRKQIAASLSPQVSNPIALTTAERADLITFVREALTDENARPINACKKIPQKLLSGYSLPKFEGC